MNRIFAHSTGITATPINKNRRGVRTCFALAGGVGLITSAWEVSIANRYKNVKRNPE